MVVSAKTMPAPLFITGNPVADKFLMDEPLALLIGMLLDQQVPMEWAFRGPWTLQERLGGTLNCALIASMEPDAVVTLFCAKPALHRYPAAMARRTHELCNFTVDNYDGDVEALWRDTTSGSELYRRLRELPGFGDEKAKIFMAILAKRFGIRPRGWKTAAVPFSDATPRSVADIHSPESLARVRAFKKAKKEQGKTKAD